mgnify:CR=1 FL=1
MLFASILAVTLAACGGGNADEENSGQEEQGTENGKTAKITIGATNEPHAVILEQANYCWAAYGYAI